MTLKKKNLTYRMFNIHRNINTGLLSALTHALGMFKFISIEEQAFSLGNSQPF